MFYSTLIHVILFIVKHLKNNDRKKLYFYLMRFVTSYLWSTNKTEKILDNRIGSTFQIRMIN